MSVGAVAPVLALAAAVLVLAVAGPRMLRHAAPALVRVPRVAVALVSLGAYGWVGAALAVGPLLAWSVSGPSVLPDGAAAVCRRCIAAANPFHPGTVQTSAPAALLIVVPAVLALVVLAAVVASWVVRARHTRNVARRVRTGARPRVLQGVEVLELEDDRPFALALPARHGGIVISTAAVRALGPRELTAVLAHERAHVTQRHHLVLGFLAALQPVLGRVPLIRACHDALPHYVEIAADNRAQRRAGTRALVTALLTMGERPRTVAAVGPVDQALHMAGTQRIAQLVRPSRGSAGVGSALLVSLYLGVLALAAVAVHVQYVSAALAGC